MSFFIALSLTKSGGRYLCSEVRRQPAKTESIVEYFCYQLLTNFNYKF